ncbi:MAG TPA: transposase [Rhabdochlamydiaceae bacterium]|nr:transposase [Rhabdochlamydiaceae bacterium]
MLIQRTIPITLEKSNDLLQTIEEFNRYLKGISEDCFNSGEAKNALGLHKSVYYSVDSQLTSQLKCSAIRLVAGAYASAKSNKRPATRPFIFRRKRALFLIGKRGRDASFSKCGKLSISTIDGRKKVGFKIPKAFQADFSNASCIDSLNIGLDGKGSVCITLEVKDPKAITPVGIDLGVRNALVASTKQNTLVISGKELSEKRKRIRKTRSRIQSKKSSKKELGKDTRSVRRVLKSLSRKQRNKTKTFCGETASKLCKWAPENAVLVFEDLKIKRSSRKEHIRKGTRRKLNSFCYNLMIQSVTNRAERDGLAIAFVDPSYTSQICNQCGLLGDRKGSRFSCSLCSHNDCADRNASLNILSRFAVLRGGAHLSMCAEARASATGKLVPLGTSN